jgi:hypothetical protein
VGPADSNGTLFAPDHFRHEPFSVFYGTGAGTVLAAATTATPPVWPMDFQQGSIGSLTPEAENSIRGQVERGIFPI